MKFSQEGPGAIIKKFEKERLIADLSQITSDRDKK